MPEKRDSQITVLIVDDDKFIPGILSDLISDGEKLVDVCHDGLSAIERIQKKSYDLIIADLVMPKVGGLDLLKYVKKTTPESIVIILTGHASLETAITAIREGAYDYIRKPCKLEEIKIVIDNAVDKIRLNRENKELLAKLQDAYHELMLLKQEDDSKETKEVCEKGENINFFASRPSNLHYLYNDYSRSNNYVDRLQGIIDLKEKGVLTENEFSEFKRHLMKMVRLTE